MVREALLLCPSSHLFPAKSPFASSKFKFPAYERPINHWLAPRRRTTEAYSTSICNDTHQSNFCANLGRRGLVFSAAMSFLLSSHHFTEKIDAYAIGVDAGESTVVRNEISKALSKAKAAGVLRLVFHDAGTFDKKDNSGGMNGSVIYELDRPENAGLSKSLKLLQNAKKELDKILQVSWADMIALGGAEAVSLCGGPKISVQLGRLDAIMPDPEGRLPEESLDATGLKKCFMRKGFSTQDLVALSGAHTLGSKGFGNPNVFDNSYFKILQEKPWKSTDGMSSMVGLPSDHALVEDDECLRWIKLYADDERKFFEDFKDSYIKLVNCGVAWKNL